MNQTVFIHLFQRFEKLCRAILASMEVENEPKVSLLSLILEHFKNIYIFLEIFLEGLISHIWPLGLVCFSGSIQGSHHSLAQTNQRCVVGLLSASEKTQG